MGEPALWIAVLAAIVSCYVGACNIALKTFSRSRLTELLEQTGRGGRLSLLLQRKDQLMLLTGVLRSGLNLGVLLATVVFVQDRWLTLDPVYQYILAFAIAAGLVSVLGVAIPVSWARHKPEQLLAWSAPLLRVLLAVLWPLSSFLHLLDPIVRRVAGADQENDNDNDISDEVLSVVEDRDEQGSVDAEQKEMLEAVFEFRSTTAGEIMTPRTDINGIDVNSTLHEVQAQILGFGHSRIPVYDKSLDHIVGILYVKDLIRYLGDGEQFNLADTLREALMVPESKPVHELLSEFKDRKVHMAIVLDEYGGTAGLITIEDILEEIVGEIQDEYETVEQAPSVQRISDDTAEVDARINIDDLNDELDLSLPENEDYDTLGGFVFSTLGHIPEQGESFEFDALRLTVTEAERTKVKRVRIEPSQPSETSTDPAAPNGNGRRR